MLTMIAKVKLHDDYKRSNYGKFKGVITYYTLKNFLI